MLHGAEGVVTPVGRQIIALGPANVRCREPLLELAPLSRLPAVLGVLGVVPLVEVVRQSLGAASGLQQVGQQPRRSRFVRVRFGISLFI